MAAAALGDDLAAVEEIVGDVHGLVEQAARIGAQVEHIADGVTAARLVDRQERGPHLIADIAREGVDVEIADAILDLPLHRAKLDPLTNDGHVERLVAARPNDRELHRSARIALHLLDRLVERDAVQKLAVDVGDVIARLDARAPRRRVLCRSDHFHVPSSIETVSPRPP